MIQFYNTLKRKKEEFKPLKEKEVGIYSCGPTVYWNQHIGHMYAYINWDVMVRLFKFLGYQTKWVMNITDVGHMTSDEDEGEDKMEKGAKREGLTVWQVAEKYMKQFEESMSLLNIQKPDVLCRATDHIQEQIGLVEKMEEKGFTYKTKGGVVFDTEKFADYAKFARLDLEKQEAGARVKVDPEKKNPWDFYLWVTNRPDHAMKWESPWGEGFPGWHLECTAMSAKHLGERFDIHTGGKEHIPVHHTNEVAQAFGAFGQQTANYWLHNDWLTIEGEKMSKSEGNMVLATSFKEKGFEPLDFRYLTLTSHYRKGINFTWNSLKSARIARKKLKAMMVEWAQEKDTSAEKKETQKFRELFIEKISDDLNTPEALAVLWQIAKSDLPGQEKRKLVSELDEVLGLRLAEKEKVVLPEKVKELKEKREVSRREKNWAKADEYRQKIEELGWLVKDTPQGTQVSKK